MTKIYSTNSVNRIKVFYTNTFSVETVRKNDGRQTGEEAHKFCASICGILPEPTSLEELTSLNNFARILQPAALPDFWLGFNDNNKTEKSFSNLAASQFCFFRSNKSTTTLQF
jgi:hypothetical protein